MKVDSKTDLKEVGTMFYISKVADAEDTDHGQAVYALWTSGTIAGAERIISLSDDLEGLSLRCRLANTAPAPTAEDLADYAAQMELRAGTR